MTFASFGRRPSWPSLPWLLLLWWWWCKTVLVAFIAPSIDTKAALMILLHNACSAGRRDITITTRFAWPTSASGRRNQMKRNEARRTACNYMSPSSRQYESIVTTDMSRIFGNHFDYHPQWWNWNLYIVLQVSVVSSYMKHHDTHTIHEKQWTCWQLMMMTLLEENLKLYQ